MNAKLSVIKIKSREGGYFDTLMNERRVNNQSFCTTNRDGSPKILIDRATMKQHKQGTITCKKF